MRLEQRNKVQRDHALPVSPIGQKKEPAKLREQNKSNVSPTVAKYKKQLLGAAPTLSASQIAQQVGVSLTEFNDYWLAMGFPPADPESIEFTEQDLQAFREWNTLVNNGDLNRATGLSLIRAQSHLADRLVLWQVEALVEDNERRLELDDTSARLVTIDQMENYIPAFESQLIYVWQRQMESLLERITKEVSRRGSDHSKKRFPLTRTLGFVDMVSYTSSSSIMGDRLVGLIEKFEYVCRSAVTAQGGRVVKMIGDAVFFIADDLATGIKVVTNLMETLGKNEEILPVRASLVQGDVFSRSGDVFGPPVNLAARLVDIAPTGDILTDAPTAAAIASGKAGPGYSVLEFPVARLRGVGKVSPYLVSIAEEDPLVTNSSGKKPS